LQWRKHLFRNSSRQDGCRSNCKTRRITSESEPIATIPAAGGGLGDQAPICVTLSDLNNDGYALDFELTIQQVVNAIQSNATVQFYGTPVGNNQVRWQGSITFDPPAVRLHRRRRQSVVLAQHRCLATSQCRSTRVHVIPTPTAAPPAV
jgi:hypothetical protein